MGVHMWDILEAQTPKGKRQKDLLPSASWSLGDVVLSALWLQGVEGQGKWAAAEGCAAMRAVDPRERPQAPQGQLAPWCLVKILCVCAGGAEGEEQR